MYSVVPCIDVGELYTQILEIIDPKGFVSIVKSRVDDTKTVRMFDQR